MRRGGGSAELDHFPALHGPADQALHVQGLLHLADLLHMGAGFGMAGVNTVRQSS